MTVLEDEETSGREQSSLTKPNLSHHKRRYLRTADVLPTKKFAFGAMSNGYKESNHYRVGGEHQPQQQQQHGGEECPVATLSNMGNTCFLNSVLYTLRFAPTFLHNLHHLIGDLALINSRLSQTKAKSSSLGRSIGNSSGPSSRSTSSKDLLSLGNYDLIPKSKVQLVTEKLHELYVAMHHLELKESTNAHQPLAFLQAVRDANYIFEGNHQQDAHELLVYLLDNIRETCDLLQAQIRHQPELLVEVKAAKTTIAKIWKRRWMVPGKKRDKNARNLDVEPRNGVVGEGEDVGALQEEGDSRKMGYNFVTEDFQGITLRRTKCLECEGVTERKEPFYDIPVPIMVDAGECEGNPDDIYRKACVTSEKLRDSNKYLCDNCMRYNEASREVSFEKLPNIMVLQLKRFTVSTSGVQKVNTFLPTPLKLKCFCERCCCQSNGATANNNALHHYQLCCVIMHLGGTMASGHYIAYVKVTDHTEDYVDCHRDPPAKSTPNGSGERTVSFAKYLKPRTLSATLLHSKEGVGAARAASETAGSCKSRQCCGVKLSLNALENGLGCGKQRNGRGDVWMEEEAEDDMWLECDDETIRPITSNELQDLLGNKENTTATPYLLFYSKITKSSRIMD